MFFTNISQINILCILERLQKQIRVVRFYAYTCFDVCYASCDETFTSISCRFSAHLRNIFHGSSKERIPNIPNCSSLPRCSWSVHIIWLHNLWLLPAEASLNNVLGWYHSFPIRCLMSKIVCVSIPSGGRYGCVWVGIEKVTLLWFIIECKCNTGFM